MKLTRTERWNLSNQYRILERLCPEEAADLAHVRLAIERGYELEYEPAAAHIYGDVLSAPDCLYVRRIVGMFCAMAEADPAPSRHVFLGFMENDALEGRCQRYVQHLASTRKPAHLRATADHRFNSHVPMLDTYRRMLAAYDEITERGSSLTVDDCQAIVDAGNRPDADDDEDAA